MSLSTLKPLIALLATAALLTACGGSGSSAPPPVGGLIPEAGEGGVTLTWTPVTGVDYWAYTGQTATICKNCGNSANSWNSVLGAQSRGWASPVTTPYFFSGTSTQPNLTNDVLYSFIMDGRINGGPGGDATPSVSATPRLAGEHWHVDGNPIGTGGITGLAFGPLLNTTTGIFATASTYLGIGAGGSKYQSTNGLSWTAIASTDATHWKNATYAFPGLLIQKFVAVGTGGAVVYSSDLATFTSGTSGVSQDLNAVASSSNLAVAVGNNGTIVRSTDGKTWTAASSVPSTANLNAVKYITVPTGGLWVAVGAGGAVFVSSDAATWSAMVSGTTEDLKGVASVDNFVYVNGLITGTHSYSVVAVGNGGKVIQSSDGGTWTTRSLGTSSHLNAIVSSNGLLPTNQFMVVGDGGVAFTSPDGVTWRARNTTVTQNLTGLIRGYNNQYLAWAANGSTVYSK